MLLQLAAQSHLIWELNNQPMAKRGKTFHNWHSSRFLSQVYAQVARRYVAQNFIVLNNTLTFLLHISRACFCFTKVSSSLKERGRFHIYPACFVSWWLKERDILHTLLIKLCFSASSDITEKFGRHTLHTRCLSGDLTGYHCVTS